MSELGVAGDESWKEMVQEAVGDNEDLHRELVVRVAQYGEFSEALRWAHFYSVDRKDWPHSVRMFENNRYFSLLILLFPYEQMIFSSFFHKFQDFVSSFPLFYRSL